MSNQEERTWDGSYSDRDRETEVQSIFLQETPNTRPFVRPIRVYIGKVQGRAPCYSPDLHGRRSKI